MNMSLEEVAMKWRGYFMEDDDQVHMTQKQHKEFARDCQEAGVSALDVYEYLNI